MRRELDEITVRGDGESKNVFVISQSVLVLCGWTVMARGRPGPGQQRKQIFMMMMMMREKLMSVLMM